MNADPGRSDTEAIFRDLDAAEGDIGKLLVVLGSLVELRRHGIFALEVERELGRRLLGIGELLLARDAVNGALRRQHQKPGDPELRQLQGLALARLGETRRACRVLEALAREPHVDPHLIEETFGILARTYKDLGFQHRETDPARARKYWKRSFRHYNSAHAKTGSSYNGINAATLALLLGCPRKARSLAEKVLGDCLPRWDRQIGGDYSSGDDLYWLAATMGEAALILGRTDEATRWYHEANAIGRRNRRFGDMGSTRRQLAAILFPELKLDLAGVQDLFPMPRVAVFAGHMIDHPDRSPPRFPPLPGLVQDVKSAIRASLDDQDVLIGYASAACGSDILFLEAVHERGGQTVVVLPYARELFCQDSVAIIPGSNWSERFDNVLARSRVRTVSPYRLALQGISYEYANRVLHGLALKQAAQLESSVLHLAVWDQRAGDGPGGTADTIGRWRGQGHDVTIIDLEELVRPYSLPKGKHAPTKPVIRIPTHGIIRGSDLVAIFFADAKGFSKLPEPELPGFVEHFLGLIARQIDALPQSEQPLKRNTWGDAVYLVLPDVCTAGRVALDIADALRHTRWSDYGLPDELTMRIGLHAGPTYRLQDPVTKRDRFVGSHISLAARIEPIVAPGRVYASEAFAVLAAEAGTTEFGCRYLGMQALPKNAGTLPVFAVERGQDHRQW